MFQYSSQFYSSQNDQPEIDIEAQRYLVDSHYKANHDQWVQTETAKQRWEHHNSRARAVILVSEAWRLEKLHLNHQKIHCEKLLRKQKADIQSPRRLRCEHTNETACACLRAPVFRQLIPKYRAMNLLINRFAAEKLEGAVDSLRRTYPCDDDMMGDLIDRYGPEPDVVDPALWLCSISERLENIDQKWRDIGAEVKYEMSESDRFATVIRNLSIMRIFLEGSQAQRYGCDSSERMRRDAVHSAVLDQLEMKGALFLHE